MVTVWQLTREAFREVCGDFTGASAEQQAERAKLDWAANKYELVADIIGESNLDRAYSLTNTVDRPWWQHASVTPRFFGHEVGVGCRSTSTGDMIQTDDGYYVVCTLGFHKVELE